MEASIKDINKALINRCRENDSKAQYEVYKLYYKQMYNTSLRILKDSALAEDMMQDSFLAAFRKIADYTGEGNFGGWLRRIVVNNSLDEIKKRKDNVSIEDNFQEIPLENDYQEEEVDFKIGEIKKAMSTLSDDYRVIISLLLFEGFDHEEVSQILNISNNTSRTRFSRARKKLQDVLTEQRSIKTFNPN